MCAKGHKRYMDGGRWKPRTEEGSHAAWKTRVCNSLSLKRGGEPLPVMYSSTKTLLSALYLPGTVLCMGIQRWSRSNLASKKLSLVVEDRQVNQLLTTCLDELHLWLGGMLGEEWEGVTYHCWQWSWGGLLRGRDPEQSLKRYFYENVDWLGWL